MRFQWPLLYVVHARCDGLSAGLQLERGSGCNPMPIESQRTCTRLPCKNSLETRLGEALTTRLLDGGSAEVESRNIASATTNNRIEVAMLCT